MNSQMQEQMNRMQMQMQRMQEDMQRQMQMMQRSMMRPDMMMGSDMMGLPSTFPTMGGMNALVDNPTTEMPLVLPPAPTNFVTAFSPKVDIRNDEKQMVVHAELPGMDKSDIKLDVKDNMLSIVAEHREDKTRDEANWHLKERTYGKFYRCFRFPENVIDDNITASFKDGVLKVMLPKVQEAILAPKQIPIQ